MSFVHFRGGCLWRAHHCQPGHGWLTLLEQELGQGCGLRHFTPYQPRPYHCRPPHLPAVQVSSHPTKAQVSLRPPSLCFLQTPPEESQASAGKSWGGTRLSGPSWGSAPYTLLLAPHESVHALHIMPTLSILSLLYLSASSDLSHSLGWLPRRPELTQLWPVQQGQPLSHSDPGLFSVGTSR